MKNIITATAAFLATAVSAGAHPGSHELTVSQSAFHLLTQPDHLALIAAALALGGYIIYRARKQA
jgi:hypothetical protein